MKIAFRKIRLSKANKTRLEIINSIIEEYQKQGYVLTLRQLYYQLVTRDVIPNKQSEYAKLSTLLKEGRMGGIVDWEAIEDRLRAPYTPASFGSPKEIMSACISQYELPRMKGQENYVEVWVEKDALSGVLKRVTKQYHIPIVVNRGYSSVSAMYDAYNRFIEAVKQKQKVNIIYLGDFDPSGQDMIRDIFERSVEFFTGSRELDREIDINVEEFIEENFKVIPIALTKPQIVRYNPPPNPAKITDPRAKDYIIQHGDKSWEVDALKPEVLNQILTTNIEALIDIEKYEEVLSLEEADIQILQDLKDTI